MKKQTLYNAIVAILIVLIIVTLTLIFIVLAKSANNNNIDETPITTNGNTVPMTTTSCDYISSVLNTSSVITPNTTLPTPNTTVPTTTVITTTAPIVTTIPKTPTDEYKYDYTADLSMYEQYMNPTGDLWDDAYLLLVNPEHPIAKDQELSFEVLKNPVSFDTSTIIKKYPLNQKTNVIALKALEAMSLELKAFGIEGLGVQSAHRTYAEQEIIFERNVSKTKKYVCNNCDHVFIGKASYSKCEKCEGSVTRVTITREEAVENVKTYSCQQGTSEHQSTLAFDLVITTYPDRFNQLIQEFGDTEAGKWLEANCYKFGFILRFPEDKEDVTQIIYEPWHFRYVGRYHASRMHDLDMCLEEYIEYLEANDYFEKD